MENVDFVDVFMALELFMHILGACKIFTKCICDVWEFSTYFWIYVLEQQETFEWKIRAVHVWSVCSQPNSFATLNHN